jgi:hypothetical protein
MLLPSLVDMYKLCVAEADPRGGRRKAADGLPLLRKVRVGL